MSSLSAILPQSNSRSASSYSSEEEEAILMTPATYPPATTINCGFMDFPILNGNNTSRYCFKHNSAEMKYYCTTCSHAFLCKKCLLEELHRSLMTTHEIGVEQQLDEYKVKLHATGNNSNEQISDQTIEDLIAYTNERYHKVNTVIDEMHEYKKKLLKKRKQELKAELDRIHAINHVLIANLVRAKKNAQEVNRIKTKIFTIITKTNDLLRTGATDGPTLNELRMIKNRTEQILQALMQELVVAQNEANLSEQARLNDKRELYNIEFVANFQLSMVDTLGYLRTTPVAIDSLPQSPQMCRRKMTIACKFGDFKEPIAVGVNHSNDIIVADTQSNCIQFFDRNGDLKYKFGELGLSPVRVCVIKKTGDIVIAARNQIQVFNQYGNFQRRFGADILLDPRAVCADSMGNIIVVESKVTIFDKFGSIVRAFSGSLQLPNGVCVNENQEIFISDNLAHCVKVFNYGGKYLRRIGGEGLTNYPIGVVINNNGRILVADNYNHFNLTLFSQDGQFLDALESEVNHPEYHNFATMNDGSIVLAGKDNQVYVYECI